MHRRRRAAALVALPLALACSPSSPPAPPGSKATPANAATTPASAQRVASIGIHDEGAEREPSNALLGEVECTIRGERRKLQLWFERREDGGFVVRDAAGPAGVEGILSRCPPHPLNLRGPEVVRCAGGLCWDAAASELHVVLGTSVNDAVHLEVCHAPLDEAHEWRLPHSIRDMRRATTILHGGSLPDARDAATTAKRAEAARRHEMLPDTRSLQGIEVALVPPQLEIVVVRAGAPQPFRTTVRFAPADGSWTLPEGEGN